MNTFWLKLRIWTKTIAYVVLILYVSIFFFNNKDDVTIWYWFGKTYTSATWFVMFFVFLAGGLAAFLIRTTLKTLQQMRELKTRTQQTRIEKELADMKAKAAMLHTKPVAPPGTMIIDSPPPDDVAKV